MEIIREKAFYFLVILLEKPHCSKSSLLLVIQGVNVNFPEVADKLIQSYLCTVWHNVTFHNKTATERLTCLYHADFCRAKFVERLESSKFVLINKF